MGVAWNTGLGSGIIDPSWYVLNTLSVLTLRLRQGWIVALDFRKFLGGEKRITEYCHSLAIAGGRKAAEVLGTEMVETDEGELTANMVSHFGQWDVP